MTKYAPWLSLFRLGCVVGFASTTILNASASESNTAPPFPAQLLEPKQACQDFYIAVHGKLSTPPSPEETRDPTVIAEQQGKKQLQSALNGLSRAVPTQGNLKIAYDLYRSWQNQAQIEALGLAPLRKELTAIDQLQNISQLPELLANLTKIGVYGPLQWQFKINDEQKYQVKLVRFSPEDASGSALGEKWFTLLGQSPAQARVAMQNVRRLSQSMATGTTTHRFDWARYWRALGLRSEQVVIDPAVSAQVDALYAQASVAEWRDYLRWQLIYAFLPYLPQAYTAVDNHRIKEKKNVLNAMMNLLPEAMQQLYVERIVRPEALTRAEQLAAELRATWRARLMANTQLSAAGRQAAWQKIERMQIRLGKPERWMDYRSVAVAPDTLIENVKNLTQFNMAQQILSIGKPVRLGSLQATQWQKELVLGYIMQQNTAVIDPRLLGYLASVPTSQQGSYYSTLGVLLAHEMSHGLDVFDTRIDPLNIPPDYPKPAAWLQGRDLAHYQTMADRQFKYFTEYLRKQYQADLTGEQDVAVRRLQLTEDLSDIAGVAVAWDALQRTGTVNEQAAHSFFQGFVYMRGPKSSLEDMRTTSIDGFSDNRFRVNASLDTLPAFAQTYRCKVGDAMVRPDAQRIKLW